MIIFSSLKLSKSVVMICLMASATLLSMNVGIWQQDNSPLPSDPLKGRLVFDQKGCIKCHAIHGFGGTIAADLGEKQFFGTALELASIMWNHSPKMSRKMWELQIVQPQFSQNEMIELVAYLYYLPYLGKPGNETKGKILFSKKGCIKCHSVGQVGSSAASHLDKLKDYLSPLYMAQAMWNHGPEMDKRLKKMGLKRPWFSGDEMVDLSAYIRNNSDGTVRKKVYMSPGNPQNGQKVFKEKNCIKCHAVNGDGGDLAPDLAAIDLKQSVSEIAAIMWNHGSKMVNNSKEMGLIFPEFTGREMADLTSYLYFIAFMDLPGDAKKGEVVFGNKGCSSCHSIHNDSELIGPDLSYSKKITSPITMIQIMWNHANIMKVRMMEKDLYWPEFEKQEMADLYAYLQKLSSKK